VAGAALDALVAAGLREGDGEPSIALVPADATRVVQAVAAAARPLAAVGLPVVVVSSRAARAALARLIAPHIPGSAVLSFDELVRGIDVDRVGEAELAAQPQEAAA
jgi:flagellar biosynthesis protein FlhA